MAHLCPTCGGAGTVTDKPEPVRRFCGRHLEARMGRLVAALLITPGRVVAHEQLIIQIWDGEEPDAALDNIKVQVCKLRKLLKPSGHDIENIHGVGYRLTGPKLMEDRSQGLRCVVLAVAEAAA